MEESGRTTPRRVLVVDDAPDMLEASAILLEGLGYEVLSARSAAEALARVDDSAPDIVLLDISLPDRSGHEVARAIRARPRGSRMFIAAVTGWDTSKDRVATTSAGFDVHVAKPFDGTTLRRLMSAAEDALRTR